MENVFYIMGIFFFIFVGAMLVELMDKLQKIANYLNKLSQHKE